MAVFKRIGSPNWFIEFTHLGRTIRRSSGTTKKSEANKLEEQWRREIHEQVALGKAPVGNLGDAITRYYQTVLEPRAKPKALKTYWYVLNRIREHFGADTALTALTAATVTAYRDELVQSGKCKPSGANRVVDHIRAILNRAANDWGMAVTPPKIKPLPAPPGRTRHLTSDEETRLLANCPPHLRDIVAFLLDSGCRKSEALNLTWDRVTFEEGAVRLTFDAAETKNRTGKGLTVAARSGDRLRELHKARDEKQPRVFRYRGKPIGNFRTAFEQACRTAKITDFRIHDLRHTYASKLVQRGVGITQIGRLLGHKTARMTERYAHLRVSDLDDAVARLNG